MLREWPLVGRQEELEFVWSSVAERSAGLVVAGAPGVGKTRLLREVLRRAEMAGRPTAWAQATQSARQIPFGAIANLLPAELAGSGRRNLLRAAADELVSVGETRLVLGLDDAHLLDEHSAAVLLLLAETQRCAIVASVRTGEAAPDSITALWKDEILGRMELQALSRQEVEGLLEAALGAPIDTATLHRLCEATRGNALFLRELVVGGIETGRLARPHGVWRWQGGFAEIPRLSDVLQERLRGLGVRQRAILELIATAEPIDLEIVERLDETGALRSSIGSGLVEEEAGAAPMVRLSHPLYAEELRASTPPGRRRVIFRALANALDEKGPIEDVDILRSATWRLESGDREEGDLFIAAARKAISRFDYVLAERLARAALGTQGIDAELALAEALIGLGRSEEAEEILAGLEVRDVPLTDLARLAVTRSSNMFWHLGRGGDAGRILQRAEHDAPDPALRSELEAARVAFLVFGGHTSEAISLAVDLVGRATATDRAVLQAASMLSWALNVAGQPQRAREVGERFIELARRRAEEVPFAADWLDSNAVFVFSGRIDEALTGIHQRHRRAIERHADPVRAGYEFALGLTYRVQGKARTAQRWLREGIAVMRDQDPFNNLSATLGELAHASALVGDLAEAEAAQAEAEAVRKPSFRMDHGHIGLGKAWVAAARGELTAARALARETADAVASMEQYSYESAALHDVARLGAPGEVSGRLLELSRLTNTDLITSFADHADALARREAARLQDCSVTFEELGADLYAAEAAAAAAQIFREDSRRGSALGASERARALASHCEGVRTPALAELDAELPLTPREREIATLAARGLSSREIADLLIVSVRTIDNHLHSAYAKLGVSGRQELSPILLPTAAPGG
jgi:DNA-binding CsgD family transcriptional regulator